MSDQKGKPQPPDTDYTALEARVTQLETDLTNLEGRVTELEAPDVEEPPPDVEQPPPEHVPGQPDVIVDGKTLQELVANGGSVTLPSGRFYALAQIGQVTEVIGNDTELTAEGLTEIEGKALFEASANLTLINLDLADSQVPDGNGGSVRTQANASLLMQECEVWGCQNGILTGYDGNTVTLESCYFHDNGAGDGRSHEIYIGGGPAFTLKDSTIFCGTMSTHAVKSRAASTVISGSHLKGNTSGNGAIAGCVLDIPDGGDALVENTRIESAPGSPITAIVFYCSESAGHGAKTLTLRNVTIVDGRGDGGSINTNQTAASLVLENCTYAGDNAPSIQGWGNVQGQFTKAA